MRSWTRVPVRLAVGVAVAGCVAAYAQAPWGFREGRFAARFAPPAMPDGNFTFCRVMYERVRTEPMGLGWVTDYPYAEINLMTRLSELTRTPISRDERGQPNHWVVRLTDDALFNCPFTMASDVGTMGLTPQERERLRAVPAEGRIPVGRRFLGKRGVGALERRDRPGAAALPVSDRGRALRRSDLRTQITVEHVPQITNIQFWRSVAGGTTSERGADSQDAHFRVIRDTHGRIMVVMTHNTDVADSWEREGEDAAFFRQFSPAGYAFGINVVLHALTH